jgi:uncharacterized protein
MSLLLYHPQASIVHAGAKRIRVAPDPSASRTAKKHTEFPSMPSDPTTPPPAQDPGVEPQLARNGGLSYLEIPAADPQKSAAFYEKVIGWSVELNGDTAKFRDQTGHLIGRWETGRAVARDAGFLPYIYVDRLAEAVARVADHGGQVVKPPVPEGDISVAIVRDPAGNLIGLWQKGHF